MKCPKMTHFFLIEALLVAVLVDATLTAIAGKIQVVACLSYYADLEANIQERVIAMKNVANFEFTNFQRSKLN